MNELGQNVGVGDRIEIGVDTIPRKEIQVMGGTMVVNYPEKIVGLDGLLVEGDVVKTKMRKWLQELNGGIPAATRGEAEVLTPSSRFRNHGISPATEKRLAWMETLPKETPVDIVVTSWSSFNVTGAKPGLLDYLGIRQLEAYKERVARKFPNASARVLLMPGVDKWLWQGIIPDIDDRQNDYVSNLRPLVTNVDEKIELETMGDEAIVNKLEQTTADIKRAWRDLQPVFDDHLKQLSTTSGSWRDYWRNIISRYGWGSWMTSQPRASEVFESDARQSQLMRRMPKNLAQMGLHRLSPIDIHLIASDLRNEFGDLITPVGDKKVDVSGFEISERAFDLAFKSLAWRLVENLMVNKNEFGLSKYSIGTRMGERGVRFGREIIIDNDGLALTLMGVNHFMINPNHSLGAVAQFNQVRGFELYSRKRGDPLRLFDAGQKLIIKPSRKSEIEFGVPVVVV